MSDNMLIDRIQSLPQELFDLIHDYTFTVLTSTPVIIDKSFKLPSNLQVSHGTRGDLARGFFLNSTFLFYDTAELLAWTKALTVEHQRLVMTLRYDAYVPKFCSRDRIRVRDVRELMDEANHELAVLYGELATKSQHMRIGYDPGKGGPDVKIALRFEGEEELVWSNNPDATLHSIANANKKRERAVL